MARPRKAAPADPPATPVAGVDAPTVQAKPRARKGPAPRPLSPAASRALETVDEWLARMKA